MTPTDGSGKAWESFCLCMCECICVVSLNVQYFLYICVKDNFEKRNG